MSYVTIYEHADMKGKKLKIELDINIKLNQVYSLSTDDMNDKMSSVQWDIKDGYKLIIYEDAEGQGRQYGFSGKGSDNNTKLNRDFNDKASSYRYILNNSVPEYFGVISPKANIIKFNSKGSVHGTDGGLHMNEHYQGVQVIDENHMIICTSDFQGAYFFIIKWRNGFLSGEMGTVIKQVRINDNFNGMALDHPGGMQILGNIVAIPIEYINADSKPPPLSSIVFYDIADRKNPVKLPFKIDRQDKPASSLGMINYGDRILLVVGGRDTKDLDFYMSLPGQASITGNTVFGKPVKTWKHNSSDKKGWLNSGWENYQSINLIKDFDNKIYLVGAKYDNDWFELYAVDITAPEKSILKKISKKAIHCENRASPEFGSGIYIAGRRIHFIVTGSGRSDQREDSRVMLLNYFS